MDLHSKMTKYITSTMTSPVTKTSKRLNGLGLTENICNVVGLVSIK